MSRLSSATLARLPESIARPGYDRSTVETGIVHLGIGAFHRAHMADYIDQILAKGDTRWGITGVSLRSAGVRDQLNAQDGLYTLIIRDGDGDRLRIMGAVQNVLVAPEDPAAVIAAMAQKSVKIISLTVTEKGYCHDPATGALNLQHPDIEHDLAHHTAPRSAIGYLVAALIARRDSDAGPVTLLSCDNLPHNGAVLGQVVKEFAAKAAPDLLTWINAHVRFPATMIDRIVPATTDDDKVKLRHALGLNDEGMVKAEPFTQWVVEDDFATDRPALETVGVQMVADVRPYELAKLRMLNGSHSTIAYLGLAKGYEFVDQAIADPKIHSTIEKLMTEAAATLPNIPGFDPVVYARDLIARFANPALAHRLAQIAMDGSQKLPQRLVQTVAENHANGGEAMAAASGIVAWMQHLHGPHVNDPMSEELLKHVKSAGNDNNLLIDSLSGVTSIFGNTGEQDWFRILLKRLASA
jgi:fructuronate reductase